MLNFMAWLLEKEVTRQLPPEWNGKVPTEIFIRESESIVDEAKRKGLTMRILGGLAIAHALQEPNGLR